MSVVTASSGPNYRFSACAWEGCGKQFESLSLLGSHIFETHVLEQKQSNRKLKTSGYHCRWEGCPRPQKPFKGCYNLEHHLRYQHTKEKPYSCHKAGCLSSFSQQSDLKEHLRKRHKEDVPKQSKRARTLESRSAHAPVMLPPSLPIPVSALRLSDPMLSNHQAHNLSQGPSSGPLPPSMDPSQLDHPSIKRQKLFNSSSS